MLSSLIAWVAILTLTIMILGTLPHLSELQFSHRVMWLLVPFSHWAMVRIR